MALPRLVDVLRRNTARLLSIPGVAGVAEGAREDGTPCIVVLLESSGGEWDDLLPSILDGYPVERRVTGPYEARGAPPQAPAGD